MPLTIGETFAGYTILRLLGSGGMGEVYLAQHPRLPRQDALKILRPDVSSDSSFRERFIREADLAAGLRHPHIVGIHDRGEYNGQLWIAMDYIDGTDAARLMQQRYPAGMPADVAIPIIIAVASALDYAHKKGLLHRDVKPANIIVTDSDTDERRVFLADFGIARPLNEISGITATNVTVGTVAYAAPEQLMGEEMDGRADQYALAATGYHLLAGVQLFPHSNPAVVISRHLNTTPPALGDCRPDCACLDDVLQTALAKDPHDRFPSCSAFAQALADASLPGAASANATTQEAPQSRRSGQTSIPTPPAESPATGSRHAWVLVGSVAAIMLLIGAVVLVWRSWDSRQTDSDGTTSTGAATSAPPPPPATAASPPPSQPPRVSPAMEKNFVAALRAAPGASWQHISWAMIPGGGADTREDDALLVAHGYEACEVMDRYPAGNRQDVAYTFYSEQGFNMESIASFPEYYQEMTSYMDLAARYLCQRNSATSATVQAPPVTPPTKDLEPGDPGWPTDPRFNYGVAGPHDSRFAYGVVPGEPCGNEPQQFGYTTEATNGAIATCISPSGNGHGTWILVSSWGNFDGVHSHGSLCDKGGTAMSLDGRQMLCVTGANGTGTWEYGH